MKQKKQNALSVLLGYAGSHRRLTLLGLGLSAVSMVCSKMCIRDRIGFTENHCG